jgi:ABC-type branched-subunit amino acid transport system substrate-binding protein
MPRRIGALILPLLMLISACGVGSSSNQSSTSQPYRFLIVLPETGQTAGLASASIGALKAGAKFLNEKYGGIGGRQVQIEALDDGGVPANDPTVLLQRLSSGTSADALFAWYGSELGLAPIAMQHKLFTTSATPPPALNDPSKYPYFFSVYFSAAGQGQGDCDYAKQKGYTKIAIVYSTGYTNPGEAAVACAQKDGITAITETFSATAVDLTTLMQRLQAQQVQAVVAPGVGSTQVGYMLDARTKLQWSVPIVGDSALAGGTFPPAQLAEADDSVVIVSYKFLKHQPTPSPALTNYLTYTKAQIGDAAFTAGGPYSAIVWDGLMFTYTAAKLAGSSDTAKMAKAAETDVNCNLCVEIQMLHYSNSNHVATYDSSALTNWVDNTNQRIDNQFP